MIEHGTRRAYTVDKCHCSVCRRGNNLRQIEWRRAVALRGGSAKVDPAPLVRKVGALQALGWSLNKIAAEMGWKRTRLSEAMMRAQRGGMMYASTASALDNVYTRLEMRPPPPGPMVGRTRREAAEAGHHPPLAWDDIETGVLASAPDSTGLLSARYDLDVVDQAMQYHDFTIPMSPAEKAEVVRRWTRDGKSEASLCRLTGWREGRYR